MKIALLLAVLLLAPTVGSDVEELAWMSGCWKMDGENSDSFILESWGKPYGMMVGTSQMVRSGKTRSFEFLRIEKRKEGIFYVAKPSSANSETSFKLTSQSENQVVFENPEHDFPKRISYTREGEVMTANVSAGKKGFTLKYKNVVCNK